MKPGFPLCSGYSVRFHKKLSNVIALCSLNAKVALVNGSDLA